ncbi:MAG: hypothetical protein AAF511_08480 [Pseudomonadota bacterium]
MTDTSKPSRKTTKRFVILNMGAAWLTFWAVLAFMPELAETVIGPLLTLIGALFGFYTGTGSADMFATNMRTASPLPMQTADPQFSPEDFRGGIDA